MVASNTTANQNGTESKKTENTEVREVFRGRTNITFTPPKKIKLPVAGTFPATVFSVAFIGTYLSRFINEGKATYLEYERIGLGFIYVDKNTGEEQEAFAEASLTDKQESRLHGWIMALLGSDEDINYADMLSKKAMVTVEHKERYDIYGKPTGKMSANIALVEAVEQSVDVGTDAKDKEIFFDFVTDYSDSNPTDKMKLLPKKHLWFIEKRSNEHGSEPMTQELYESRQAEIQRAHSAAQAEANQTQTPPPQN